LTDGFCFRPLRPTVAAAAAADNDASQGFTLVTLSFLTVLTNSALSFYRASHRPPLAPVHPTAAWLGGGQGPPSQPYAGLLPDGPPGWALAPGGGLQQQRPPPPPQDEPPPAQAREPARPSGKRAGWLS